MSSAFSREAIDKSNEIQRQKYGKDYSAEMKRRRAMRKTYSKMTGFALLKKTDPERFKQIIANREEKRRNAGGSQETTG